MPVISFYDRVTKQKGPPSHRAQVLHERWKLRCATVEEVDLWLGPPDSALKRSTSMETFCGDGRSSWCQAQAFEGRCVLADLKKARDG